MQGRDSGFGDILENVMTNVEEADAQAAKVAEMVKFYGKVLEGNTPHEAIMKLAEEHKMTPEEVFEMLKAGGHVNVETLDELKAPEIDEAKEDLDGRGLTGAEKELAANEKIGEPKAEKVPDMKPKGHKDHGSLKQVDAMGANVKHKADTTMGGPAQPKAKIGEPKAEKVPDMKADKDLGNLKKISDGKSPDNIDDLKEEDQIKTLTEQDEVPSAEVDPVRADRDYVISEDSMEEEISLSLEGMTRQEFLDIYNAIVPIPGNELTMEQVQWDPKNLREIVMSYRDNMAAKLAERKAALEAIQNMDEGALAKEVDGLSAAAKKALDADEYDTAMDLVARLAQVQAALPAKIEPAPKPPVDAPEDKKDEEKEDKDIGDKNEE
jgi:hypothetical protein